MTIATALSLLAGCEAGSTPSAAVDTGASAGVPVSPSGAPSPSPSRTPSAAASSPPASPVLPPARTGPRGQEAFARYVMDLWGAALRTDDASALLALGPRHHACDGCRALASELGRRHRAGWHVDFPGLEVHSVRLAHPSPGTTTATARVTVPASTSVRSDGSFRSSNPEHPRVTFTVTMQRDGSRYRLLSFRIA